MTVHDDNAENKERGNKEIPVKEIAELLDAVSDKVPKLLDGIQKSYYSQENGANTGRAVGAFYKELIGAGIPNDLALKLTENYMISFKDIVNVTNNGK